MYFQVLRTYFHVDWLLKAENVRVEFSHSERTRNDFTRPAALYNWYLINLKNPLPNRDDLAELSV